MATASKVLLEDDGKVVHFAWPGGYRVWYMTGDGGELCAECVQENLALCQDVTEKGQWFVEAYYTEADIENPGPCDHCGRKHDV